jgi:SAM-dependent methyltransferase
VAVPRRDADAAVDGADRLTVDAGDLVYASRARAEAEYWARTPFGGGFFDLLRAGEPDTNRAYTGDPARPWIEYLIARGPFGDAAVLGCDEAGYERFWLQRNGSERLDVYELSPGVIRRYAPGSASRAGHPGTAPPRCVSSPDLNFAHLPERRYDVIWSSGCLHHIANLEYLFAQVEGALRPGGLFAFRDYIGERRMQFDPQRLARINALLEEVPAQWRRTELVVGPRRDELSPFCGVRSDEILALATQRFELVHKGEVGALFPFNLAVDLDAIDAPHRRPRALRPPNRTRCASRITPCAVYRYSAPAAELEVVVRPRSCRDRTAHLALASLCC